MAAPDVSITIALRERRTTPRLPSPGRELSAPPPEGLFGNRGQLCVFLQDSGGAESFDASAGTSDDQELGYDAVVKKIVAFT